MCMTCMLGVGSKAQLCDVVLCSEPGGWVVDPDGKSKRCLLLASSGPVSAHGPEKDVVVPLTGSVVHRIQDDR